MAMDERTLALRAEDVWLFTKQAMSFDTAFSAVRLLEEMPAGGGSVEEYFARNHARYGIDTGRHRVLVISQLFGLLSKGAFYAKGGRYQNERVTPVYQALRAAGPGTAAYNRLKTEQLLKVRVRAIIDSAGNNLDYAILPVLFSYQVLARLREEYGVDRVPIEQFYTHVMTCARMDQAEQAAARLAAGEPASPAVAEMKSRSRFLTMVEDNLALFTTDGGTIGLEESVAARCGDGALAPLLRPDLTAILTDDESYRAFLTQPQGLQLDLVTAPDRYVAPRPGQEEETEEEGDAPYTRRVEEQPPVDLTDPAIAGARERAPRPGEGLARRPDKDPRLGRAALQRSGYRCQCGREHESFVSAATGERYLEAHHLIPLRLQAQVWREQGVNLDCLENLVALCPTCHRAVHYGSRREKKQRLRALYEEKKRELRQAGVALTWAQLKQIYGLEE